MRVGVAPSRDLKSFYQRFCRVQCTTSRRVLDLLATRNARSNDYGVGIVFNSGKKPASPDCDRDVVMFLFVAERTGHATTSRIDFLDRVSHRQRFFQISRADEGL